MLDARIHQDSVAGLYDGIAPVYDLWAHLTESRSRERCLELAAIRDGESVLEVAVGTGLTFERILLSNPTGRNEGIDLSGRMLAKARKRARKTGRSNYRLTIGDAFALGFENREFDVLINSYLFDLLPEEDFPRVLTEFRRVVRPGGRIIVVNMTEPDRPTHHLWEQVYRLNPAWLGGCRGVRILPAMRKAGFTRLRREYVSQTGFPSEIVYGQAALI